jgi:hypothetical protein
MYGWTAKTRILIKSIVYKARRKRVSRLCPAQPLSGSPASPRSPRNRDRARPSTGGAEFTGQATSGSLVLESFPTVHQQKAEPVAHSAAYMAAVPFGFGASSPRCAGSVHAPIVPSACGARRSNANPVCTRGAALVAVAPAARARSRGTEARVQEAHTRRKTERRSVRPRIRQRRSIASVWPFVHLGNRRFLKPLRRMGTGRVHKLV